MPENVRAISASICMNSAPMLLVCARRHCPFSYLDGTTFDPAVEFCLDKDDGRRTFSGRPMDGQMLLTLIALYRPNSLSEVARDLFPSAEDLKSCVVLSLRHRT